MSRKAVTDTIIEQVRDVVESQSIDVETLCLWLGVDQMDIIDAFEDHVINNAAQFGINPTIVADLIESDLEATDEDYTE